MSRPSDDTSHAPGDEAVCIEHVAITNRNALAVLTRNGVGDDVCKDMCQV